MNRDASSYERQVIDALKTILRALGSSGGSNSSYSSSSTPSSSSERSLATALNGISTRLDGINSDLKDIIVGEESEPETESESE